MRLDDEVNEGAAGPIGSRRVQERRSQPGSVGRMACRRVSRWAVRPVIFGTIPAVRVPEHTPSGACMHNVFASSCAPYPNQVGKHIASNGRTVDGLGIHWSGVS